VEKVGLAAAGRARTVRNAAEPDRLSCYSEIGRTFWGAAGFRSRLK